MDKDVTIARIALAALHEMSQETGYVVHKEYDALEKDEEIAIDNVHFLLSDCTMEESAIHDRWVMRKIKDGWVYGSTVDGKAKAHFYLVPYACLPQEERFRHALFKAIVFTLGHKCSLR